MPQQDRAVTPVISTVLVVAIVVILAATVSVAFLGITENLTEPAPIIADTTGEFDAGNTQIVRITHVAGDSIGVENIEINIRVFDPEQKLLNEVRLINLPADSPTFCPDGVFAPKNFQGDPRLISQSCAPNQVLTSADSNTWSPGRTIQFQIRSQRADFSAGGGADTLEVIIVHTPSNAIISENVFRP